MSSNFISVLTPLKYDGPFPIEVVDGFILDRPNQDQLEVLRKSLKAAAGTLFFVDQLYEYRWEKNSSGSFTGTPLPPEEWNYWVVNYQGTNDRSDRLATAFELCRPSVELGIEFVWHKMPPADGRDERGGYGLIYRRAGVFSFFDSMDLLEHREVSVCVETFVEVQKLHALIERAEIQYPEVYRLIQRFNVVKCLPRRDPFFVLAQFTILEALIAHNPHAAFDSLTHQVSEKMNLLARRFSHSVDDSAFPAIKEVNQRSRFVRLWKKLYGLRSKIAHGAVIDFEGEFKCFGDLDRVREYVRDATRKVLVLALHEPDLVSDLRGC